MYYAYLTVPHHEFQELFPQGVPTFGFTPDDFLEIYDAYTGELLDIEPAFRVNRAGLTWDQELALFQQYTATMNDPRFVQGMFMLLDNGWFTISESQVQSVVWRDREEIFCFQYNKNKTMDANPLLT